MTAWRGRIGENTGPLARDVTEPAYRVYSFNLFHNELKLFVSFSKPLRGFLAVENALADEACHLPLGYFIQEVLGAVRLSLSMTLRSSRLRVRSTPRDAAHTSAAGRSRRASSMKSARRWKAAISA